MPEQELPEWVPEEFRPTERQRNDWWEHIISEDGSDSVGWWIGWCPLHDSTGRDPQHATAEFNFHKDAFRCLADEPCHAPKKGMSLTNLKARVSAESDSG